MCPGRLRLEAPELASCCARQGRPVGTRGLMVMPGLVAEPRPRAPLLRGRLDKGRRPAQGGLLCGDGKRGGLLITSFGGLLTEAGPDELRAAIIADYALKPVRRDYRAVSAGES